MHSRIASLYARRMRSIVSSLQRIKPLVERTSLSLSLFPSQTRARTRYANYFSKILDIIICRSIMLSTSIAITYADGYKRVFGCGKTLTVPESRPHSETQWIYSRYFSFIFLSTYGSRKDIFVPPLERNVHLIIRLN